MTDEADFDKWFAQEYPALASACSSSHVDDGWGIWTKQDQEYAKQARSNMLRAWKAALDLWRAKGLLPN